MKKLLPAPSPTSHFPRKRPRDGNRALAVPVSSDAAVAAGNSTRSISERLKLCRWPSLKTITIVPEPLLGGGGVLAKPIETARQSIVAKPATLTNLRMGFSFAITGATAIDAPPRQSHLRGPRVNCSRESAYLVRNEG